MAGSPPAELFAIEAGHGPTVLMVHGLGGDHTVWNEVAPRLADRFRAVAVDLRGHGRSPLPPGSTFSFEELEGDLRAEIGRRSEPPVHLVGLSAGALLALRLARDHPESVASMTLINGAAYIDPHTREVVESWQSAYREGGAEALNLRLTKDLFDRDWTEAHLDLIEKLRGEWTDGRLGVVARWSAQVSRFDLRGQLGRIRAPTLVLQSMGDAVIDPSHGRFLRVSIPGAELKLFPACGHMLPIERPEEVAQAIAEFVSRSTSVGSPPSRP
ncbi:MAG: alpha/beta fold hydrolase [Thermoplasmata archaeon]